MFKLTFGYFFFSQFLASSNIYKREIHKNNNNKNEIKH